MPPSEKEKGGDVTITRTGGTTTSQTLKIVSSDGSATLSDDDYAQVNKTVTFAAGETSKTINISTTADLNVESDESFTLTMTAEGSDEVPPQITDGSATVTIKADDFERGNSLYTVTSGPRWSEAEQDANRLGGHLVTVNSSEENQWLIDTFSSLISFNGVMGSKSGAAAYTPRAWIGLSDKEKEGEYKWSSGQNLTYFEPSRGYQLTGSNQNYISIQLGDNSESSDWNAGMWEDRPNYDSMYEEGIAEIPLGGTPTYTLSPSTSSIDEKSESSVRFNISTTNVDTNTRLYYTASGSGVTASDFSSGNIKSSRLIGSDGKATFVLSAAADKTTEGTESFNVKLYSDFQRTKLVATSSSVSIADTSTKA
jgi:hypothetical protein